MMDANCYSLLVAGPVVRAIFNVASKIALFFAWFEILFLSARKERTKKEDNGFLPMIDAWSA